MKKEEKLMSEDEFPRPETTLENLSKLKSCFLPQAEGGTVTAGNASGINDGAALLLLSTMSEARAKNLTPLVKIVSWSQHGGDPMLMGVVPIQAIQDAVRKVNWSLDDVDLFEINEAFSSQSIAIVRELKLHESKVSF